MASIEIWDRERNTIEQFAERMALERGALSATEHYQQLWPAIWRGELAVSEGLSPITREELRDRVRLFDSKWRGLSRLEITKEEAGQTLRRFLLEKFPSLPPETLVRMGGAQAYEVLFRKILHEGIDYRANELNVVSLIGISGHNAINACIVREFFTRFRAACHR